MHTHHTLTLLCLILAMNLGMGCSYMDEDIHLSDEEFMESVTMEGIGFGGMGMRGYGRSGCGGGGWGHDGSSSHTKHHTPRLEMSLDALEAEEQLNAVKPLGSDGLTNVLDEPEEPGEEVYILTNHDLVAQVARARAH